MRCANGNFRHSVKTDLVLGVIPITSTAAASLNNCSEVFHATKVAWLARIPVSICGSLTRRPNKVGRMLRTTAVTNDWVVKSNPQVSIGSPAIPNPIIFRQTSDRGEMSAQAYRGVFSVCPVAAGEQVIGV